MPNTCGYTAYKLRLGLWDTPTFTHTPSAVSETGRAQPHLYTQFSPHVHTFLYTFLPQQILKISSVTSTFVHIFHRAYKQDHDLKKGII